MNPLRKPWQEKGQILPALTISALGQLVNVILNCLITDYSLNVIELQITNYNQM